MNQVENQSLASRNNKIVIGYSTVFGTAGKYAKKIEKSLSTQKFVCISQRFDNLYNLSWLQNYKGILILLVSTTGDGDCSKDAEQFKNTLQKYKSEKVVLTQVKFCVLGLGSTVYPKFCQFAKYVRKSILQLGGYELLQPFFCDSNIKNQNISNIEITFPKWQTQLIRNLKMSLPLQQSKQFYQLPQRLRQLFDQKLSQHSKNKNYKIQIQKKIQLYQSMKNAQIISIKQLRRQSPNTKNSRSTLHIKASIPQNTTFNPACNVNIFPQNLIDGYDMKLQNNKLIDNYKNIKQLITQLQQQQKQSHILIGKIKKISLLNVKPSRQIIDAAFANSEIFYHFQKQSRLKIYKQALKNKNLTVKKLIKDYQPKGLEFYNLLELEKPRSYTLCSWDLQQKTFQICISIVENGLTSQFIKNKPSSIKITPIRSGFYIPHPQQHLLMIGNGVGISPFRSIVQYMCQTYCKKNLSNAGQPYLHLYYGIQNEEIDFYFREEWKRYQEQNIINLKIAESRKNPQEKQYIQDLITVELVNDILFKKNGLIFICGGCGMADGIKKVILNAIRLHQTNQERVNQKYDELKRNSIIVEEVFH